MVKGEHQDNSKPRSIFLRGRLMTYESASLNKSRLTPGGRKDKRKTERDEREISIVGYNSIT